MRIRLLFTSLALAGAAHAADSGSATTPSATHAEASVGKPMAWRYRLLQAARASFEEGVAARAPGAVLLFRLPKVDPSQGANLVEIVQDDGRTALPMPVAATFSLPAGAAVTDSGAMVVVDRHFPKGEFNHPNLAVRSPGLPEGVRRMGDLRLACSAQVAMAKAEALKFRALLATAALFGLDLCGKMEVNSVDTPSAAYDTIVIEDGERRLVRSKGEKNLPRLGETSWSDDARISYLMKGRVVTELN